MAITGWGIYASANIPDRDISAAYQPTGGHGERVSLHLKVGGRPPAAAESNDAYYSARCCATRKPCTIRWPAVGTFGRPACRPTADKLVPGAPAIDTPACENGLESKRG